MMLKKYSLIFLIILFIFSCSNLQNQDSSSSGKVADPPPTDGNTPNDDDLFGDGDGSDLLNTPDEIEDDYKTYDERISYFLDLEEKGELDDLTGPINKETGELPKETIPETITLEVCLGPYSAIVLTDAGILYTMAYGTERLWYEEDGNGDYIRHTKGLEGTGVNTSSDCPEFAKVSLASRSQKQKWKKPGMQPFNLELNDKDPDFLLSVEDVKIDPSVDFIIDKNVFNKFEDTRTIIYPKKNWTNNNERFTITIDITYAKDPYYEDETSEDIIDDSPTNTSNITLVQSILTFDLCIHGTNVITISENGTITTQNIATSNGFSAPNNIFFYGFGANSNFHPSCDSQRTGLNKKHALVTIEDIKEEGKTLNPKISTTHTWFYPGLLPYIIKPANEKYKGLSYTTEVYDCTDISNSNSGATYNGGIASNNINMKNHIFIIPSNPDNNTSMIQSFKCAVYFYIVNEE